MQTNALNIVNPNFLTKKIDFIIENNVAQSRNVKTILGLKKANFPQEDWELIEGVAKRQIHPEILYTILKITKN